MDTNIPSAKKPMKKSTKVIAAAATIAALMAGGTTFAAWTSQGEVNSVRQLESAKAEVAMLDVTATKKVGTVHVPITLDEARVELLEPGQEMIIYHNFDTALYLGKTANLSMGLDLEDENGDPHDLAALAKNTTVTLEGNTRNISPTITPSYGSLGARPLTNLGQKTLIVGSVISGAAYTGEKLDGHPDFRWVIKYTAPAPTAAEKKSRMDAQFIDFTKVHTYLTDNTVKP